ncbi:adenosylcobinamide-GDP ribazoletransferase [Natronospira proteinivora]|uniref:Adenosylcobinamide-GDP ribazoletransferase n=1 Tax=Natronospira proteinivora TaxID=1807133 RepID=A0ABT1G6B0_9GAMM|nr:adenosylcobinamide-GDP ribazoletransferase [Natronospira proteinivora]MCP1726831.1 adenosylcobinamide-GDP ribazoletransferase [Natronospira proteinivora]
MMRPSNDFLLAVSYFTRLPVAGLVVYSGAGLSRAAAWFPFVGWLSAAAMVTVLLSVQWFLPSALAVLLAMLAGVLITGAFHEDGLADTGDGFGPVADRDQALAAMKDARLGVFGLLTLLFVLGGKYLSLSSVAVMPEAAIMILVAQPLSRLPSVWVIARQDYVSQSASRARAVAEAVPRAGWLIAAPAALVPLFFFFPWHQALMVLLLLFLLTAGFSQLCQARFGGYTGDTLGALQQLSELLILITLLVFLTLGDAA